MSPSATELKQALSKGTKIGSLVWYDCRNASVTPVKLKALFDKHGLDFQRFRPEDIKIKHAFQKACRLAMTRGNSEQGEANSSDTRKAISKKIVDEIEQLTYGIVDLDVHEKTRSIDPDFSARVWLDKKNWTVSFDKKHWMADRIVAIFNELKMAYTTRDISRMVVNALDQLCSVSLRDAGVIYFVPGGSDKDLHALQGVVNEIGQCNMRVYSIGDDNGNAKDVTTTARTQISDKLAEMKADLKNLKESIESGRIKGDTIENSLLVRQRRYNELKERCKTLADALKIKAESLMGDLEDLRSAVDRDLKQYADSAA